MESIPNVDKRQARELWDEVNRNAIDQWSDQEFYPPFSEIDFKCKKYENQGDARSPDDVQTPRTETEPSNLGQYIDKAATLNLPSLRRPKQMSNMPSELQAILSGPIKYTMPLIHHIYAKAIYLLQYTSLPQQGKEPKFNESPLYNLQTSYIRSFDLYEDERLLEAGKKHLAEELAEEIYLSLNMVPILEGKKN